MGHDPNKKAGTEWSEFGVVNPTQFPVVNCAAVGFHASRTADKTETGWWRSELGTEVRQTCASSPKRPGPIGLARGRRCMLDSLLEKERFSPWCKPSRLREEDVRLVQTMV